ncbi:MAG: TRAP transporter substrate-binding protein [Brevinema sp.]
MKKILVCVSLLTILVGCGNKENKKIVWKLGHIANEDHIWHQVATKFAEEIHVRTDGKMEIKIYPNSLEGNEVDNINGIRAGVSQMTFSGESLQNWAEKAAMMAVPYAFRDRVHIQKTVEGEVGQEIAQNIEEKAGLIPLFYVLRLPRQLTSNRPIKSPGDLNSILLRVPAVPLFVKTWEVLGAKPTPMAFNELFTSLQQGTVEAQENPVDLIHSGALYEVQRYVNQTDHVYSWIYGLVGVKQFNKLTPELQEAVQESAQVAQDYGIRLIEEIEESYINDLKAEGMVFVEVDKDAFIQKAKPAVEQSLTEVQKVLYQKIQSL